jgi:serine protease inhibitor
MRRSIVRLLAAAPLILAAGCDLLSGPGGGDTTPLTELPRPLSVTECEVIRGSNDFAFGILRETLANGDEENIFLSPLSASMALGMTLNGARGETYDEMRDVLGFAGMQPAEVNAAYRDLIDLLLGLDRGVAVHIANGIFADDGFPFHAEFFELSRRYFDAEVATPNFHDPATLDLINNWVKRKTQDRIPTILDELDPDYVMFLINALYFKGDWREQFDPRRTAQASFTRRDGRTMNVNMMRADDHRVRVNWAEDATVLELPYGRDAFAMTIVLPNGDRSVDALVESLDPARWDAWIAGLADASITVGLPRFRLEYETMMNDPLITLGMGRAFGVTGRADFTGMSPRGHDLEIGMVIQKTFVDVNEVGTEAAAATAVGMRVTSMPPAVVVDRPFIVAIRERFSGTILFLGTIGAPGL